MKTAVLKRAEGGIGHNSGIAPEGGWHQQQEQQQAYAFVGYGELRLLTPVLPETLKSKVVPMAVWCAGHAEVAKPVGEGKVIEMLRSEPVGRGELPKEGHMQQQQQLSQYVVGYPGHVGVRLEP